MSRSRRCGQGTTAVFQALVQAVMPPRKEKASNPSESSALAARRAGVPARTDGHDRSIARNAGDALGKRSVVAALQVHVRVDVPAAGNDPTRRDRRQA